jgi:hypothetical protein
MTIGDIAKMPEFADVPMKTLEYWRTTDQWTYKRDRFLDKLNNDMARKVGSKLTQYQIQTMKQVQEIKDIAINKLKSHIVDANSWEGVMNAFLKAVALENDMRASIAEDVTPFQGDGGGLTTPAGIEPDITEVEAQAMITAAIRARREQIRKKQGIIVDDTDEPEIGEEPKAEVKVINGER